jgi:hypothetical protein
MKKRILSLLIAMSIIINMVSIATVSVSAQSSADVGLFRFEFNQNGTILNFVNGGADISDFAISFSYNVLDVDILFELFTNGLQIGTPTFNNQLDYSGDILYTPSDGTLILYGNFSNISANQTIASFTVKGTGTAHLKGGITLEINGQKPQIIPVDITLSNAPRGHVLGNSKIGIGDALAVLKHLAGITTLKGSSFEAALITPQSQSSRRVSIGDVLEILKHLAGIKKIG